MDIVKENWESSLFLKKNSNLLLIFYAYQEEPIVFRDYIIELVDQWELPAHDLRIIKQDWNKIKSKVDA